MEAAASTKAVWWGMRLASLLTHLLNCILLRFCALCFLLDVFFMFLHVLCLLHVFAFADNCLCVVCLSLSFFVALFL